MNQRRPEKKATNVSQMPKQLLREANLVIAAGHIPPIISERLMRTEPLPGKKGVQFVIGLARGGVALSLSEREQNQVFSYIVRILKNRKTL